MIAKCVDCKCGFTRLRATNLRCDDCRRGRQRILNSAASRRRRAKDPDAYKRKCLRDNEARRRKRKNDPQYAEEQREKIRRYSRAHRKEKTEYMRIYYRRHRDMILEKSRAANSKNRKLIEIARLALAQTGATL